MSEDKPAYDVQQAQLALEQDRQARIAEARAILERELTRLRIDMVGVPQKVMISDGVWGDKIIIQLVPR